MGSNSVEEFFQEYPDNDVCLEKLFRARYSKPICPRCCIIDRYLRIRTRPCYECICKYHMIHPMAGTVFQDTKVDLVRWFFLIYLLRNAKNGVCSMEIHRQLKVTQKTAWYMIQKATAFLRQCPRAGNMKFQVHELFARELTP